MTVTGHSIGLLADANDSEQSVEEQLAEGNRLLKQATCTGTRLAKIQNEDEAVLQAVEEAGYRALDPDLDRTGYQLRGLTNANSLLRSISGQRNDVSVWLADTVGTGGLRSFLSALGNAEGQCLAWTETA